MVTYQADFVQEGRSIPYTPGSAVSAGAVVVIGNVPLIAKSPIAANALGALHCEGVFRVVKKTGAMTLGPIYWDADGDPLGGTAGSGAASQTASDGPLMGSLIAAAAETDTTCLVRVSSHERTATVAGSVTADAITGSDASLGINGIPGAAAGAGGIVAITGGLGHTNAAGGAVPIIGGQGAGTGAGGAASLVGGASGTGATGNGANASVTGGAAASTNGSGGSAILTPGVKAGSGIDGGVFSRGNAFQKYAAASAEADGAQAITAAQMINGIVVHTVTGASALSTPTGAAILAGCPVGMAAGDSFLFHLITLGTGADDISTLTAGDADVTFVGKVTVGPETAAIANYGTWLFRYTGGNAFVGYRIG